MAERFDGQADKDKRIKEELDNPSRRNFIVGAGVLGAVGAAVGVNVAANLLSKPESDEQRAKKIIEFADRLTRERSSLEIRDRQFLDEALEWGRRDPAEVVSDDQHKARSVIYFTRMTNFRSDLEKYNAGAREYNTVRQKISFPENTQSPPENFEEYIPKSALGKR